MKKLLLFALTSCLSTLSFSQTNWQWAHLGGSTYSWQGGPMNTVEEEVKNIATDPNGNLYVLSRAANRVYIGGDTSLTTDNMYVLTSWACDGHLRWIKSIGPSFARNIGTDTLGGVYLTGFMSVSSGNYFDADTTIAPQGSNVLNGNYIVKYDTSGNLQWLHMPDPLVITAQSYVNKPYYTHMAVAPNGDVHNFTYLPAGVYENGTYTVSNDGYHVMKYNKNGVFMGGTHLPIKVAHDNNGAPMESVYDQCKFNLDAKNGRYYLSGSVMTGSPLYNVMIGNDTLEAQTWPRIFVSSFDLAGNVKWIRCQDSANNGNLVATSLDAQGNIYIAGQIFKDATWNGTVATGPAGSLILAMAACMDINGVNKWMSTGHSPSNGTPMATAIAANKNNVVKVVGLAADQNVWGAFSLNAAPVPGCTMQTAGIFLASLDATTGVCTGLDSARTVCGNTAWANSCVTDRNGNFYVAGMLYNPSTSIDTVMKIGSDHLVAVGGDTDFFLAKYGVASCAAPITQSVGNTTLAQIKLFPNPVTDVLTIEGNNEEASYAIYNSVGVKMASGSLAAKGSSVDVASFAPGFYFLQLYGAHSERVVLKFVKK